MTEGKLVWEDGRDITSSNCWLVVLQSEETLFEKKVLGLLLAFLSLHVFILCIKERVGHPLNVRPTVVASTLHGAPMALGSLVVLYLGAEWYWIWTEYLIPFSVAYFMSDIVCYCMPKLDVLIFFHHLTMIVCHMPVCEPVGAWWGSLGRTNWVIWLSMMGYTSELAVPLLSGRWWMMQTLEEHCTSFFLLSSAIVVTFVVRVFVMAYLLVIEVLPLFSDYMKHQQYGSLFVLMFGHFTICLLSAHWLRLILRGGLKNYTEFRKRDGGSFSYRGTFLSPTSEGKNKKSSNGKKDRPDGGGQGKQRNTKKRD